MKTISKTFRLSKPVVDFLKRQKTVEQRSETKIVERALFAYSATAKKGETK
jgi:hypothetical protein